MADQSYRYDVFISYTRADERWAMELADRLTKAQLKVFIDQNRLDIGKPWEEQLLSDLRDSQHMIALWSGRAKDSLWVLKEQVMFEPLTVPKPRPEGSAEAVSRRLIPLRLDDTPPFFPRFQMLDDLKMAATGSSGFDAVGDPLWQQVTDKIVDAIRKDTSSIPIMVAILAMTAQEAQLVPESEWEALSEDLTHCQDLGVTKDNLRNRYGVKRSDWKPFEVAGQITAAGLPQPQSLMQRSIGEILDRILDGINNSAAGNAAAPLRYRWQAIEETFWQNTDAMREHTARLVNAPLSLVVIDAISLKLRKLVEKRAEFVVSKCLGNERSAILVLPPFGMTTPLRNLRRWIEDEAAPLFDPYFRPLESSRLERIMAQWGICCQDDEDMGRVLQSTISACMGPGRTGPKPPYLQT